MTIQQEAAKLIAGATDPATRQINTQGLAHYLASLQSTNMQHATNLYHEIRGQLPSQEWQTHFDAWMTASHQHIYTNTGNGNYATQDLPDSRSRRRHSDSSGSSDNGDGSKVKRALRPFENNPMQNGINAPEGHVDTTVRDHVRYGSDRTRAPSDVVSFTRSDKFAAAYATRPAIGKSDAGTGYFAKATIPPGAEYYDSSREDHRKQAFPPKRKRGSNKDPAVNFAKGAQEVLVKAKDGQAIPPGNVDGMFYAQRITPEQYEAIKQMTPEARAAAYPNLEKMVRSRYQAGEEPHPMLIFRHEGAMELPRPNRVPGSDRPMTPTGESSGSHTHKISRV